MCVCVCARVRACARARMRIGGSLDQCMFVYNNKIVNSPLILNMDLYCFSCKSLKAAFHDMEGAK